ncbi:DUF262 domain-containing protein [Spirochaetales bacterium NM-380-WT-3C1]|uniref:DUF262 domain-containing protein n=1 Tax=Bullifex porci TaxID=2606638 RepID=A0A7X2PDP6_9SPIO|nr:DUF262 domain-containing protein [Bullifex porci]MSU06498.1 DUF262 domain-containing protein [Bullifex porci]
MNFEKIEIGELFNKNLLIPDYQRPYRWKVENAQILFDDLYASFKKNKEGEYRIGSIVLFHDKEDKYYIIDGQQRVTTLLILLYCLGYNEDEVLDKLKYNSLSGKAIKDNQRALKEKCKNIESEKEAFTTFILNNCTFIEIVTENEADSFIYFDSLNSKGKPLSPHDLLKAYHLRLVSDIDEKTKKDLVEKWEKADEGDNLFYFFYYNLYPIVRWSNGLDGNYYDTDKINTFKGIPNNDYPYSKFFQQLKNQCFLLSEPFIAGKGFFDFVSKYLELKNKIEVKINEFEDLDTNEYTWGNYYVKQLYINVCIFFADRFGIEKLDDSVLRFFYKWAYTLRINKSRLMYESINRYALYGDYGINAMNIFMEIKKMITPDQIYSIHLADCEKPDPNSKSFPFWKSIYGGENE